ncbi:hypothetical protein [Halobacillus karajensis]|nr:hypothetical protein [Halobacillus karajensis]
MYRKNTKYNKGSFGTRLYAHGYLVLGGFVPEKSDVGLIVVTKKQVP